MGSCFIFLRYLNFSEFCLGTLFVEEAQHVRPCRGLKYIRIDLKRLRLFVFVDASFANNADLTSQLGYVIVLGNEEEVAPSKRHLLGNLIHWQSTKCKRVTRSTLASEIYAMVTGADIAHALKTTLDKILTSLGLPRAPVVVCTDSFSLYSVSAFQSTVLSSSITV